MSIPYRSDIDGLRAVAILIVVAFHAFPSMFPGGFIGVDVFFVISGFLITSILRNEMREGHWSIAAFYSRRILRIFPALVLVLLACLVAGWHTLLAEEYMQLGKHIALGATFVSNVGLWWEAGYFDKVSDAKPLLHLWSLAIEEQFYIVWPVLLWAVLRFARDVRLALTALTVTSFCLSAWLVWRDQTAAFYSPLSRAWELLIGAALALNANGKLSLPNGARPVALAVLLFATLTMSSALPFPGLAAAIPVLCAAVLIGSTQDGDWSGRLLKHPWMVSLGRVSYPWYLWHWPLLSFAFIIESGNVSIGVRATLVAASLALASLTYLAWERPLRKTPRRVTIFLLVFAMVLMGIMGKNIFDRHGLERIRHKNLIQVSPTLGQDFLDFEKQGLITDARCEKPFKFPERDVCLTAHIDQAATAVVLGDSHAVHAFWGLAEAFDRIGLNLSVRGKGACVPVMGKPGTSDPSECERHMDGVLRELATDHKVRAVSLVFRGRYLNSNSSEDERKSFEERLGRTLDFLLASGKRVYYFLPVVEPGFDPRLCTGSLPMGRKPPYPCTIDKEQDDAKSAATRTSALTVLAKRPTVLVVDPNMTLCSAGTCPIIQQGHSMFKDDNHLSHAGSLRLAQSLAIASH